MVNCDKLVTERSRKIPLADRLVSQFRALIGFFCFVFFFSILSAVAKTVFDKNLLHTFLSAFKGRAVRCLFLRCSSWHTVTVQSLRALLPAVIICIAPSDTAGE